MLQDHWVWMITLQGWITLFQSQQMQKQTKMNSHGKMWWCVYPTLAFLQIVRQVSSLLFDQNRDTIINTNVCNRWTFHDFRFNYHTTSECMIVSCDRLDVTGSLCLPLNIASSDWFQKKTGRLCRPGCSTGQIAQELFVGCNFKGKERNKRRGYSSKK